MNRGLAILMVCLLAGCTRYEDSDWMIRPGEASDSIAIESGPGDQICVRHPESGERTCVRKLPEQESR